MDKSIFVKNLKVENQTNPLGIDISSPRFSWMINTEQNNVLQSAYHLIVADEDGEEVWNTGKTDSDQSVWIPYKGPSLKARKCYFWKVRIWDNKGQISDWSKASWEMGLLGKDGYMHSFQIYPDYLQVQRQASVASHLLKVKKILF